MPEEIEQLKQDLLGLVEQQRAYINRQIDQLRNNIERRMNEVLDKVP
jgi:hypothetical protein